MPCDCSYMNANERERLISVAACIIETNCGGRKPEDSHWNGYHPMVYGNVGQHPPLSSVLVATACRICESWEKEKHYRMMEDPRILAWWEHHKKADLRRDAIAKLTPEERAVLGLT
jgi:hypothetical protein